nr:hypothetical protein [Tanacetum cinerariifolium]
MSTRSSARNIFPPLDNPELTIQRRSRADPTLLSDFEIAAEGNGGPITPIAIQAMNFGLKNDMIQHVHNSCQLFGLPGDDANKHLDKLLHVTQGIKVNGVTDDAICLYLFPHSLTYHATAWFDRLPRNSINAFKKRAKMFLDTFCNGFTLRHRDTINAAAVETFMKRHPEECCDLIKNMTSHHNDWDTSAQLSESSSSITSSFDTKITELKAKMAKINKNLMRVLQVNQQVKQLLLTVKLVVVLIPSMIVQPPLARLKTYILREPTKVTESPILNSEPVVAPIIEPVTAPVSAPKPNQRPSIPYLSRLQD